MVIDEVLPEYDVNRVEHVTVGGEPVRVYAILLEVDLMQARRESPGGRAIFAARGAPDRVRRRIRKQPPPPPVEPLRLEELDDAGTWVKLGEDFGKEFVFGAIGRLHGREVEWRPVETAEFADFGEPGHLRVAAAFSVQSFGIGRSVLSGEARVRATDEGARRRLLIQWRAASPAVRVAMRGSINHIRKLSEGLG
jgi:hypothetical protein